MYGRIQGKGNSVSDRDDMMRNLSEDRDEALAHLNKNTIRMRLAAIEAEANGYSAYRIAKLLGVTHRTVSLWLKK